MIFFIKDPDPNLSFGSARSAAKMQQSVTEWPIGQTRTETEPSLGSSVAEPDLLDGASVKVRLRLHLK